MTSIAKSTRFLTNSSTDIDVTSVTVREMAAYGASSSLRPILAKVSSPNRRPPFRLGRGNWSSCPAPAVRDTRRDRLNWVDSGFSCFARPRCQFFKERSFLPKPGTRPEAYFSWACMWPIPGEILSCRAMVKLS